MSRIEEVLVSRFSYKNLIVLFVVLFAYLFGFVMATGSHVAVLLLQAGGVIVFAIAVILAPMEWILLGSIILAILADSKLVSANLVYYARFVPLGALAARAVFDLLFRRHQKRLVPVSFLIPGLFLLLIAFVSSVYSIDPSLTLQRSLSMAFVVIGFSVALPMYMSTRQEMEDRLKRIIGIVVFIVVLGTLFYDRQGANYYEGGASLVTGLFKNPNMQGLVCMVLFFPTFWWWQRSRYGMTKWLAALSVLTIAGLIMISGSRASILGSLCGVLAMTWFEGRTSGKNLLFLILGLVIITSIAFPDLDLAGKILSTDDAGRYALWQHALDMGSRAPILGIGFGAASSLGNEFYLGAHNSYLYMFVELGAVGVIVGITVFALVLLRVFVSESAVRGDALVAALSGAIVAGLVDSFFEDGLFSFGQSSSVMLWFFLALLALRVEMLSRESEEIPEQIPVAQVTENLLPGAAS